MMKTATIYCRVSTEDPEREGTSLESQMEACLNKARDLGTEPPTKEQIENIRRKR